MAQFYHTVTWAEFRGSLFFLEMQLCCLCLFLATHYGIIKYSIIFLYYLCNFQFFTFWVTPPGMILRRSLWTHMQDSCQVVYWEALLSHHNGDHFNFILNIANYLQNGCACVFTLVFCCYTFPCFPVSYKRNDGWLLFAFLYL